MVAAVTVAPAADVATKTNDGSLAFIKFVLFLKYILYTMYIYVHTYVHIYIIYSIYVCIVFMYTT